MKSRFHYFKHQSLTFWWFLDFRSPGSPYLFILLYQNASRDTRKCRNILEKYYLCKYGHQTNRKLSKVRATCFYVFHFFDDITSKIVFCGDEDRKLIIFPIIIKSTKAWILIPYLSKNIEWKFGKSYELVYFQGKESSNIK